MRYRDICSTLLWVLLLALHLPSPAAIAADFTVSPLPATSDIAVYEVSGDYDAVLPDGSFNATAREEVAREFYRSHPDAYDFLVIFSNFDFRMPASEASAFYHGVKNDVQGIGKELFDNSEFYGSQGRLQGVIDMGNIAALVTDPLDPRYSDTMGLLSHELLHRWAAEVTFQQDGSTSNALLGSGGNHWSFLLDTAGSLEYGNRWLANGDGTFTALAGRRYFSPLDLYLMGLLDKSAVPPLLLIDNPEIDPARLTEPGVTISGSAQSVTIDQIIAAEGERVPGAAASQKSFRIGCIFIIRPGTYSDAPLPGIRNITKSWPLWFSGLTSGLGTIAIDGAALPDLPDNPGPDLPPIDPRTAPPEINDGVAWLLAHQLQDGSWQDSTGTADRDTTTVLTTLADFTTTGDATARGVTWLEGSDPANFDYLARRVILLHPAGQDTAQPMADLIARQNPDGGWGSNPTYDSSAADTALALQALTTVGGVAETVLAPAVSFLRDKQHADGGWGTDGHSDLQSTLAALAALTPYRVSHQLAVCLGNGLTWLAGKQNSDGGFGGDTGTVYHTAQTLIFQKELGLDSPASDQALAYLLARQAGDGSWSASAFQTALAVRAIRIAMQTPDLSVSTEDLVPEPATITTLPTELRLAVTVHNSGLAEVPAAKVVLYDGAVDAAHRLGEASIAIGGQSSATHVFTTVITDSSSHHFFAVVDPDNEVRESSEQNNSALRIVYPETSYDFAVAADRLSVTPATGAVYQPLTVTATVANSGTNDAVGVPLHLIANWGNGPLTVATLSVDLPAGGSNDAFFTWTPERSGAGLVLTVVADPLHAFTEVDEGNNSASLTVDINGATEPDLTVAHTDIGVAPAPAQQGASATLRATIRNRGFSSATGVRVDFIDGVPGQTGASLIASTTIAVIAPGESGEAVAFWENIPFAGQRMLTVVVDPQENVAEIRDDNNSAFTTMQVLALPDLAVNNASLAFSPEAPREGDPVTLTLTVQNTGEQPATGIPVTFRGGGEVIGTAVIPEIGPGALATATMTLETTGRAGLLEIEALVDPEGAIREQDTTNNRAGRGLGIQNGDLWLSYSYFSPNGDGVQDSTQFGCRLAMPQDVTVGVVNRQGETVREFSGPDFLAATFVSLTWDGLDSRGQVVADGPYRIQVRSATGTELAALPVTVDTNRSTLRDAAGTNYTFQVELNDLLQTNTWLWFPDDSGIVLLLDQPTPDHPSGLYTLSPTGGNITRIVPPEWNSEDDPDIGYRFRKNSSDPDSSRRFGPQHMVNPGFSLTKDGFRIAFILERYNKKTQQILSSQLWSVNRFGEDLKLLASYDQTPEGQEIITDLFWSPDGAHIAYKRFEASSGQYRVTLFRADGTEAATFAPQWTAETGVNYKLFWAPDNRRFVFAETGRVSIADLAGNTETVMTISGAFIFLDWLPNGKLLVRDLHDQGVAIWIVALDTGEEPMLIGRNLGGPLDHFFDSSECIMGGGCIAPVTESGHFLADAWYTEMNKYYYFTICDANGSCQVASTIDFWYGGEWHFFSLTPDGKKFIVNYALGNITQIYDLASGQTEVSLPCGYSIDDFLTQYADRPPSISFIPLQSDCSVVETFAPHFNWNWLDPSSFLGNHYSGSISDLGSFDAATRQITNFPTITQPGQTPILSPAKQFIADETLLHGSLANLTAILQPFKTESHISLQGIAADLHFTDWKLEYADRAAPQTWHTITPFSDTPVVNSPLATWVPPAEGSYLVRLTVRDKAGNTAEDKKVVNWGKRFSISNIYKTGELFSPNGDTIKDTVGLNYTVREPIHLELRIQNEDGAPVRTFSQDHALPGQYGIVWDGRDEAGGIVPDGIYTFRLLNYEFLVQVDTTPPELDLGFSPVQCGADPSLLVNMAGLARDKNLRHWVLSVGEGEQPTEWHEFRSGETTLGDSSSTPEVIQQFTAHNSPAISFLTNTTFKLLVEDYAGNKGTVTSRFHEELLVLSMWDGNEIPLQKNPQGLCEAPSPLLLHLLQPGRHTLTITETLQATIKSATVQYRMHMLWHDTEEIIDPPRGDLDLVFDTTSLSLEEIAAVRVKMVDAGGIEYYSTTLPVNPPLFEAHIECFKPLWWASAPPNPPKIPVRVSLAESLTWLTLQATTTAGGSDWVDVAVTPATDGITYQFHSLTPDQMASWLVRYPLRVVGIGESGRIYTSKNLLPPKECPPDSEEKLGNTRLTVSYSDKKAGCNTVNESPVTVAVSYSPFDGPELLPDLVRYYVEENGAWGFLKEFAPAVDGWGSVAVYTGGLSEGVHRVKIDLVYGEEVIAGFKENVLTVDRTLPEARIISPAPSVPVCARQQQNEQGVLIPAVDIEGVAEDSNGIDSYSLYYGRNDLWSWIASGKGTGYGKLGQWDVTGLESGTYPLQLSVTDGYGNTTCTTSATLLDADVSLLGTVAPVLFSPNGDSLLDTATVRYEISEQAQLGLTVWQGGMLVRTLLPPTLQTELAGTLTWDGRDDGGMTVPDGTYRIDPTARDSCGNSHTPSFSVTVDNSPPTAMISHPGNGEPLAVNTEVRGTVTDPHLLRYQLHVKEEDSASNPTLLAEGSTFVENNVLGVWNTFGLTGNWVLILSAEDRAGNKKVTQLPVTISSIPQLFGYLGAEPRIFSPNGDGRLDTTTVTYVVTEPVNLALVMKDSGGNTVLSANTPNLAAGSHPFLWAGLDDGGSLVADGTYTLSLTAENLAAPFTSQTESVTLVVDTAPPAINLSSPPDTSYHAGAVQLQGDLRDPKLLGSKVTVTGGPEPQLINTWIANGAVVFADALELPEGSYQLQAEADDMAANSSSKSVAFTVDKSPPRITLTSPADEEFFGGAKPAVAIKGLIEEPHLQSYRVQYGVGARPTEWIDLAIGEALPQDNLLATWNVGPEQNLADGDYTIRVTAVDKAGLEGAAEVAIRIDNHPPELALTQPEAGSFVSKPLAIVGSVNDQFLKEYTLQLAGTACAEATAWSLLRGGSQPVAITTLASLPTLPADGAYCLRLAAEDQLGNTAEQLVPFTIDTTPPAPPVLTGSLESAAAVALQWSGNSEPDLAGFNLYRNGVQLNSALLTATQFLDQALENGTYAYTVRAVDLAGLESRDSNREAFTVDLTPPEAMITSPLAGARVGNYLDIKGRAYSADDFKEYRVFRGAGDNPQSWQLLRRSPVPIPYGVLVRWDALSLTDGPYTLRLEAEDLRGNVNSKTVLVTVDNSPPAPPVLLSADPAAATVTLAWQANMEPDLTGYLVYRDEQLANAAGVVLGDLTPYLITDLGYTDTEVPDGTHTYFLLAMDSAGNLSDQSNALQVPIDTHAPHLRILNPAPGHEFEQPIQVRADSEDTDIAAVRFQYRQEAATSWTDLGGVLSQRPYLVTLDPVALAWENGPYRLRAVATDQGGLTDPAPEEVQVHFKDLTPPPPPAPVSSMVNGGLITLSWTANPATDIAGYNVYLGEYNIRKTSSLLTTTSFQESVGTAPGWYDGTYQYKITAVDTSGNESTKSPVSATVFTPILDAPPARVSDAAITLGGTTVPGATVEIHRKLATGSESLGTVPADPQGRFGHAITLVVGNNSLFALATDTTGNVSQRSSEVAVLYDPAPAPPTGLAAVAAAADVALTWNPNTEPDLAGYHVYRRSATGDWQRVNAALVAGVSYPDASLANGGYIYRITAVDQGGGESGPSSEVSVTVEEQPPLPPTNLVATARPEGSAIDLCWQPAPPPAVAYHLYRSLAAGGPYTRISDTPTPDTCFPDSGLINTVEYFYVARSVDAHGNESGDSNEASAIPGDAVAPDKPLLLLPTISGRPYQSPAGQVDIVGYAEAGAMVDLLHDQEWIDTVWAQAEPIHALTTLDSNSINETVATPDGKYLYFTETDYSSYPYLSRVYRRDLASGEETTIDSIPAGSQFLRISPFGEKMAYEYTEGNRSRIGIYDLAGNTAAPLTAMVGVDEREPDWSRDGTKIVFAGDPGTGRHDIWLHDLTSGQTSRVTQNVDGLYPELSPDGQQVAFLIRDSRTGQLSLQLVPVQGGTLRLVATGIDQPSEASPAVEWSPAANQLAFTASADGMNDIALYDTETGTTDHLTTAGPVDLVPLWSPDGKQIAYVTATDSGKEIHLLAADGQGGDRLLHTLGWSWISEYAWAPAGIFFRTYQDLHHITPPGTFTFAGVALHPGQNFFSARAEDGNGNVSAPADEIEVAIEEAAMPDLEVLASEIFVYPNAPLAGDQTTLGAVVRNRSAVAAENVRAEIYLWDATGTVRLLHAATIPVLDPGAEEWLSVNWDSTGMAGRNTLYVLLDPDDAIGEAREDNNIALREFYVAGTEGIAFATTLNGTEFASDETVAVEVALHNSGPARDVHLAVTVEDSQGAPVAQLASLDRHLPYGSNERIPLSWTPGSVLAGGYRVRTLLTEAGGALLGEESKPFIILPDIYVYAALTTDKPRYGGEEEVALTLDVVNDGVNYIIPELRIRLTVADQNQVLHTEEQVLTDLAPGDSASLTARWNTARHAQGRYTATAALFLGEKQVATADTSFAIDPVLTITGTVAVTPKVVFRDGIVQVDYRLTGRGNVEAGAVPIRLLVVDPRTWTTVASHEATILLAANTEVAGQHQFAPLPWDIGVYRVELQRVRQDGAESLATDTFTVRDGVAPALTVLAPVAGSILDGPVELAVTATDDGSGVASVEYQLDNGAWLPLPLVQPATGRYASRWLPGETDEGPHTLRFRATDLAGNVSLPVASAIELRPRISLSASTDKASYGMDAEVAVSTILANTGWEKHLHLALTIETRTGVPVAPVTEQDLVLAADGNQTLLHTWNTGTFVAGDYNLRAAVSKNGTLLSETLVPFAIEQVRTLTGTLTLAAAEVALGDPVIAAWTLTNTGNCDLADLNVDHLLTDQAAALVRTWSETITLARGQSAAGSLRIDTADLAPGPYGLSLKAQAGTEEFALAAAQFTLLDTTPPEVSISTPAAGTVITGEVEVAALATDTGTGVEAVEFRIDQQPWQPLPRIDPAGDTYAARWTPTASDEGERTIGVRARDRSGNLSTPVEVAVRVELCDPFAALRGSLDITPTTVTAGEAVTLGYTLQNACGKPLAGVQVRVVVLDPVSGEPVQEFRATADLAPVTEITGSFILATGTLAGQEYPVRLEAALTDRPAKTLADSSFTVLPAVEGGNIPLDQANLLVWLNHGHDDCEDGDRDEDGGADDEGRHHQHRCGHHCAAYGKIVAILAQATDSARIVCSRAEFEEELRNPFHTDFLIIGNQQPLTDHHRVELRERVHAGAGLLAFAWNKPGDDHDQGGPGQSLLGVKTRGMLPGDDFAITLAESPIGPAGTLPVPGPLVRVEAAPDTVVAGWVQAKHKDDRHLVLPGDDQLVTPGTIKMTNCGDRPERFPALVLHEYGLGRTVYAAFDLCAAFTAGNEDKLATLLHNGLAFVHRPTTAPELIPHLLHPFALQTTLPVPAADLRARISCPAEIRLFDPATGDWVESYPWESAFPLREGATALLPYYLLASDQEGVFRCQFSTGQLENGQFSLLHQFMDEFIVEQDRNSRLQAAIEAVGSLPVSRREQASRTRAQQYLQAVLRRSGSGRPTADRNIHDLEKALAALLRIESTPVTEVRLQLDTLLRMEQARWYFSE